MERIVLGIALVSAMLLVVLLGARAQWIERKTEPARHPPPIAWGPQPVCDGVAPRPTLMVGDSRVSRWPMGVFADPQILNRGVPGEMAVQMAARFEQDILARCPQTILIASGVNDLVAASLMDDHEARLVVDRVAATLIELAERGANAGARVYVATIVPPGKPDLLRRFVWSGRVVDEVLSVNATLRAHIWHNKAVSLADFAARLDPLSAGVLDRRFCQDTLHLNATAYSLLTELLPFTHRR